MPVIGRYSIYYFSSAKQSWIAEIRCYDLSPVQPANSIASLRFFKSGVPIPADSSSPGGKAILNYPLDRFNDVIGILRSETQVSVDKISELDATAIGGIPIDGFCVYTSYEFTGDLEVK